MNAIVDGLYHQGKIELLQTPGDLREGRIRLIILNDSPLQPPQLLAYGKYSGDSSTLEDFKDSEWNDNPLTDEVHGQ